MLWATLAFILIVLSHGSTAGPFAKALENAESRIEKAVHDSMRRDRALEIVKKAKGLLHEHAAQEKKTWSDVIQLTRARGTTRATLEDALAPLQHDAEDTQTKVVELRFQLVGVLTREEWHQVFPIPAKTK